MSFLSMKIPLRRLNWYQVSSVLKVSAIEDLDAVVVAIADEQAAPSSRRRAPCGCMNSPSGRCPACRTRAGTCRSCRTDEPRRRGRALPWPSATKMSPFGVGDHVVRLIEDRDRPAAGLVAAGLAERHRSLPSGLNLKTWWPIDLRRSRGRAAAQSARRTGPTARQVVLAVGHPDVAVAIDVDAVREDDQPGAEALTSLPRLVELAAPCRASTSRSWPRPSSSSRRSARRPRSTCRPCRCRRRSWSPTCGPSGSLK